MNKKPAAAASSETLSHFSPTPSLLAAPHQQPVVGDLEQEGGKDGAAAGPLAGARARPRQSTPSSSGRVGGALICARNSIPARKLGQVRLRAGGEPAGGGLKDKAVTEVGFTPLPGSC